MHLCYPNPNPDPNDLDKLKNVDWCWLRIGRICHNLTTRPVTFTRTFYTKCLFHELMDTRWYHTYFPSCQMISLFLIRTAASSPASPTTPKTNRPSGGAGSVAATTSSQKYLTVYNEVSDIFGETIAVHTQLQPNSGNNLRSVFMPYRANTSKVGYTKNQDGGFGTQNISLKKEPQSDDDSVMNQDFLQGNLSVSETAKKHYLCSSLQTSLGTMNSRVNWRKRRITQSSFVFDQDNVTGTKDSKRIRLQNDDNQGAVSIDKAQVCKLSRRFFKIQRIRLIDLARIPSTTFIIL